MSTCSPSQTIDRGQSKTVDHPVPFPRSNTIPRAWRRGGDNKNGILPSTMQALTTACLHAACHANRYLSHVFASEPATIPETEQHITSVGVRSTFNLRYFKLDSIGTDQSSGASGVHNSQDTLAPNSSPTPRSPCSSLVVRVAGNLVSTYGTQPNLINASRKPTDSGPPLRAHWTFLYQRGELTRF